MPHCELYSYEGKNWPNVSFSEIEIGQWLLYLDDMYFGQVIAKEKNNLTLCVTNFRTPDAFYKAHFTVKQLTSLRNKPKDVFVDPQIKEQFPKIHKALEWAFVIWQKLDGYILEAKNQGYKRQETVPAVFLEFGRIFGKWASAGYMPLDGIDSLQKGNFIQRIYQWKKLEDLAQQEDISENLLVKLDGIRSSPFNPQGKLSYGEWLAIYCGFFEDTLQNKLYFEKT